MPTVDQPHLDLNVCPHCGADSPVLQRVWNANTTGHRNKQMRQWAAYACRSCGGVVTARAWPNTPTVDAVFPAPREVSTSIPEEPRRYLRDAHSTFRASSASIMASAAAVDAMLKQIGYTEGSLYRRIEKAAEDRHITDGMKEWAHRVRLDANAQRHADTGEAPPSTQDAENTYEFAETLAEILFVLPARIREGTLKKAWDK